MHALNKNSILPAAVLLFATFFSSSAQQTEPKSHATYKMRVILTDKIQQTWENRFFLNLDLRTNLLYNVMLSPTVGFEWHINRYWGIKVDGCFTHWGSKHGMVHNVWLVNPELRWYIKNTDLFYIGFGGNAGRVNIYRGVVGGLFFPEDTGYQGSLIGGSISAGYKLIWSRSLSFDFNLGIGGTYFKYDSFTVIDQTRVYQRIKMKDATKNLLGPTQAGVSLVWKISGNRKRR